METHPPKDGRHVYFTLRNIPTTVATSSRLRGLSVMASSEQFGPPVRGRDAGEGGTELEHIARTAAKPTCQDHVTFLNDLNAAKLV